MTKPELEIIVDATHAMGHGYGHGWKATVREVVAGELADPQVALQLFANAGGNLYGGRFKTLGDETGVRLTLRRIEKRPAALVGFVAQDGTIWQLVSAQ